MCVGSILALKRPNYAQTQIATAIRLLKLAIKMKHPNSPEGRLNRLKERQKWSQHAKDSVHVPRIVLSHKVIVVGKSENKRGWWEIATVWIPR